jgi:PHD/YefM family antitoxin component YafN of YafNO toxin-antitoxin module
MKTLSLTDTRNRLLEIAEKIEEAPSTVVGVSKRGRPLLTILSTEAYESLLETMEILADDDLMHRLRKAAKEAKEGKTIPLSVMKKRLGLDQ